MYTIRQPNISTSEQISKNLFQSMFLIKRPKFTITIQCSKPEKYITQPYKTLSPAWQHHNHPPVLCLPYSILTPTATATPTPTPACTFTTASNPSKTSSASRHTRQPHNQPELRPEERRARERYVLVRPKSLRQVSPFICTCMYRCAVSTVYIPCPAV
jgi:hypothetical protein